MTKSDLMDQVATRLPHLHKGQVLSIVEAFFDTLFDSMARGERIEIRGFGSFSVKIRKPKNGRNPKTGEAVAIPEKRMPWFTVGDELKNRVDAEWRREGHSQVVVQTTMVVGSEAAD